MNLTEKLTFVQRDDFPAWVSDEALVVAEYFSRKRLVDNQGMPQINPSEWPEDAYRKLIEQHKNYFKLFDSLDMIKPWEKATTLHDDKANNGQIWFAIALWDSIPFFGQKNITRKQADKWKNDMCGLLSKAREMAHRSPDNTLSLMQTFPFELKKALAKENVDFDGDQRIESPHIRTLQIPYIFNVLDAMIRAVESIEYDPYFHREYVNSKTANRSYFIRKLTCAFLQKTGKPCRRIVATAASAAYSSEVSEREVIRTTKNLEWEDRNPVVSPYLFDMLKNENISKALDSLF